MCWKFPELSLSKIHLVFKSMLILNRENTQQLQVLLIQPLSGKLRVKRYRHFYLAWSHTTMKSIKTISVHKIYFKSACNQRETMRKWHIFKLSLFQDYFERLLALRLDILYIIYPRRKYFPVHFKVRHKTNCLIICSPKVNIYDILPCTQNYDIPTQSTRPNKYVYLTSHGCSS